MSLEEEYAEIRYKDGLDYAQRATFYDQQGHFSAALTFYSEAVEALNQACDMNAIFTPILPRVEEYSKRAFEIREYLRRQGDTAGANNKPANSKNKQISQLEYLMEVAILLDEEKRYKEAERTYTSAVELAIKIQGTLADSKDKAKSGKLAKQALERLESIKKPQGLDSLPEPPQALPSSDDDDDSDDNGRQPVKKSTKPKGSTALPYRTPLVSFLEADPDKVKKFDAYSDSTGGGGGGGGRGGATPTSGRRSPPRAPRKGDQLTEAETKILRTNSKINGVVYVPWAKGDLAELRTVSSLPMDFTDPDGLIRLADKQKARLAAWQRPGEICENPKMFHLISSFSIKQTLIGDCSFVASLGVCADFEKKFKKRLITSCIYPQNRHGDPIINPNGKYFIRLYLNGCRRKVVIDDLLPVDAFCNLLCSHSNSRDEFWISLLEKAYMKVMGGYDFPGSSSNNDLYALTGWIPERIDIKESDPQLTFKLVESKLRAGQALVTMGTGPLTKEESERSGLVPTHAYAVLKAQTIHGHKLFRLKNPWSEKRWKGHFSENDTSSWTPELKKALNYDQAQARQVDNGVFWIDWKSVIRFYDTLYINWNPDMFHYKYTIHDFWKPGEVEKDLYNISNNPQYSLQVSSDKVCTIWILLSRHITTKSDFAKNEKFITLHVAGNTKGKRLYLPPDRAGYVHTGVKINTPHYLVKLTNIPAGNHSYTVIVSQLDSLSTIYYTIKVYGTCNFKFNTVPSIYAYRKELKGQWKANRPRPSYKLTLPASCNVMVELKGPRKYYVWIAMRRPGSSQYDSGPARSGYTVLQVDDLSSGEYTITPSTYVDGQEGPFFITVFTDGAFDFQAV